MTGDQRARSASIFARNCAGVVGMGLYVGHPRRGVSLIEVAHLSVVRIGSYKAPFDARALRAVVSV
jgi:hypothetical protein